MQTSGSVKEIIWPAVFTACLGYLMWYFPEFIVLFGWANDAIASQNPPADILDFAMMAGALVTLVIGVAKAGTTTGEGHVETGFDRVSLFLSRSTMLLIVALVSVMTYEVILRYIFERPTLWANELSLWMAGFIFLLAGLYADGETTVREPHLSRDHSERMLSYFGAEVRPFAGGVTIVGGPELTGQEVFVPGDISSAAFFMVAALITPGSELLIRNVGVNPTRSGIIDILRQMGGSIELLDQRERSGEPVADLLVRSSDLRGIEIGGALVPRAIDEFPVVSVAACFAEGATVIRDARELRVKETDRIAAMCDALSIVGAQVEAREDGMVVQGVEQLGGGTVASCGDHRIAMSMAVAALRSSASITIDDTGCTETSFPGFWQLLTGLAG